MKFIISSTVLLKNLQAIIGVISANNNLPILDDVLFELREHDLKITASDLETTMSVTVQPDRSEEPGEVAIPAKLLADILKTFPDIPLSFSVSETNQQVEISAGEGKYKLSGHKSDEFPRTPPLEGTTLVELQSDVLARAINKTLFATGNDELRLVLSGVFCELTPEDTTFVATDAHKLVRYKRTDARSPESVSFILPKKPMSLIKNLLAAQDVPVKLEYNIANAFFSFQNISLVCRLIDGKYPNYEAVIPTNNPNKLTIDRVSLLTSIRRISIFANQSTHQIRLRITGKELVLSAEDIDFSNEARERLTCSYEGDDLEIGFNSKFMAEMLNNLDTDEIMLELSAPNRAGILLPVGNENKNEDILMLVMPVMLAK